MTLAIVWALTLLAAYVAGRRHGLALARTRYADERARGRLMLAIGSVRGRRRVVDVEITS